MDFDIVYKERVKIDDIDGLVDKLRAIVGEEWVSTEDADLVAYSQDAYWLTRRWMMQGKLTAKAHVITWPESAEQISKIMGIANELKIPVVPFGEGSGVMGAAIPIHGGIVVDMKRFTKIIDINDKNLTLTVETGLNGKALERLLEQKGYRIGHVPQSFYTSTVGGWIAHRAAGQFSTKYGKIEDIVVSLQVVLPTGEIINTKQYPRASNGPQVERLFLSSEGTLGIVTHTTLKMWPMPEEQKGTSFAFDTMEGALESVRLIMRKQVYPAVVRIYDKMETERHFYKVKEAKKRIMVIFVCEGVKELVDFELSCIKKECVDQGGIDCGEGPVEHWFETRFHVTEMSRFYPKDIIIDTAEVACMWEDALSLYNNLVKRSKQFKGLIIFSGHASHFYPQGVCWYFSFGGTPTDDSKPEEFFQAIWDTTVEETLKSNGVISHHHGVGLIRAKWMKEEHGPMLDLMRKIKKVIDPNNIMNPGKLYDEAGM
ncbi:MAG: FAD-binding oxidoreductase [Candidatus Hodarchaeota archaeon]